MDQNQVRCLGSCGEHHGELTSPHNGPTESEVPQEATAGSVELTKGAWLSHEEGKAALISCPGSESGLASQEARGSTAGKLD